MRTAAPTGSRRALQLSIFDVSDLANPKRTAQTPIGTAWAYSEAMWDHHAFNWYRPDPAKPGLLAIPFSDWIQPAPAPWWSGFVSDVRLFSVDPAGSISAKGSLGMGDVYIQQGSGNWTWWYRPWVRRSVMATDVAGNTYLYAVSDAGVRSAALSSLGSPLATALFQTAPDHIRASFPPVSFLSARPGWVSSMREVQPVAMRLFFVCVTMAGSAWLLWREQGDRKFAIGALAASCIGMLLQLNVVTLHVQYARTVVWAAIAVFAALAWTRVGSKSASTVAASVVFVSALTVALSLRILR